MSANRPKPKTPYQRLLEGCKRWAFGVVYPQTKLLWTYTLDKSWSLKDLRERVAAARELGWRVELRETDDRDKLQVVYVQKPGSPPWEIAP